jgi:cob(I)alamin adenosyltransferase
VNVHGKLAPRLTIYKTAPFRDAACMKIYTRQGDGGMSALFDGTRVPKNHPRLKAYGTLDELNSHLGLSAAQCPHAALKEQLAALQQDLLVLGSDLATPAGSPNEAKIRRIGLADVLRLEGLIDSVSAQLPPLKRFIIPGGGVTAGHLHVARTVCRRAEILLVELMNQDPPEQVGGQALIFVNRLSDLLFCLARLANKLDGRMDVEWITENPR